ncbi:hypothetical protein E3N88_39438 [Mikania micrantha]|uniref:Uncharacterized protein n=1 Tax=Mikania micrantha TaxID=192012 RepID=A0A5N6LX57_9ASTR|nr:hypothetical protein E3N88_39438 [Mikania micrantha]
MADENTYGGSSSSEKVELTETQVMVKEEVAKAFEAALPTYIEEIKASLKDFLHQELADFEAGVGMKQSSKTTTFKEFMPPSDRELFWNLRFPSGSLISALEPL